MALGGGHLRVTVWWLGTRGEMKTSPEKGFFPGAGGRRRVRLLSCFQGAVGSGQPREEETGGGSEGERAASDLRRLGLSPGPLVLDGHRPAMG